MWPLRFILHQIHAKILKGGVDARGCTQTSNARWGGGVEGEWQWLPTKGK